MSRSGSATGIIRSIVLTSVSNALGAGAGSETAGEGLGGGETGVISTVRSRREGTTTDAAALATDS